MTPTFVHVSHSTVQNFYPWSIQLGSGHLVGIQQQFLLNRFWEIYYSFGIKSTVVYYTYWCSHFDPFCFFFLASKNLFNLACCLVTKSCPNLIWCHVLETTRLLCPWDSPGKITRVSCHFLLQRIFLTQELSLHLLRCRQFPDHSAIKRPLNLVTGSFYKIVFYRNRKCT